MRALACLALALCAPFASAGEQVRESITDDGLHIWSYPDDGGQRFVLMVLVGSGARQEEADKAGLAHLLEHVLLGTTAEWNKLQSARVLEEAGGSYNGTTGHDFTTYYLTCPPDSWELAVDWLAAHLVEPTLSQAVLEQERRIVFEELDSKEPHAGGITVEDVLYPGHALGRSIGGDKRGIEDFQRADLREFYDQNYRAPNMAIGFSGKVPRKECVAKIARAFRKLNTGGGVASIEAVQPASGTTIIPSASKSSAWLQTGFHLPTEGARGTAAQLVIVDYLARRGFDVIREEHQLSYAPHARLRQHLDTTRLSMDTDVSEKRRLPEVLEIWDELIAELAAPRAESFEPAWRAAQLTFQVNRTGHLQDAMELSWLMRRAGESPLDLQRAIEEFTAEDLAAYATANLIDERRFTLANATLGQGSPLVLVFLLVLLVVIDGFRGFIWLRALRARIATLSKSKKSRGALLQFREGDLEKDFQDYFDEQDGQSDD